MALKLTNPKPTPSLAVARRRWGAARVLTGAPTPPPLTPTTPAAPAVALPRRRLAA